MALRAPALLVPLTAALVVALVTGCTGPDGPGEPEQVDDDRIDLLAAAPPFDAAAYDAEWTATDAREAPSSTNVVAHRATLTTEFPLPDAGDSDLEAVWADVFPLARELYAEIRANGWAPVAVSCEAPAAAAESGAVQVYATAALDGGVVAALSLRVGTGAGEVTAEAAVPFHTEDNDPWGVEPLGAETCLDAETPPDDTVSVGTPLELSDVRP